MSEELTLILSNNYYWNQPLARRSQLSGIIGIYCPRKQCGLPHHINYFCSPTYKKKAFHFPYFFLFSFVFSCFSKAAEGVILILNLRFLTTN